MRMNHYLESGASGISVEAANPDRRHGIMPSVILQSGEHRGSGR